MAINFRRLNAQIRPFKQESKRGFIFIATDEQKDNFIPSVAKEGSRRSLIRVLTWFIHNDEDFAREFKL